MNKTELIKAVAAKGEYSQTEVANITNLLLDEIKAGAKKDGAVQLIGFGTFKTVKKKAGTARNPATGETIKVPAKTVVKFVPGSAFKDEVNKKGRK